MNDFKYKHIPNFLNNEECELFYTYAKLKHLTNTSSFENPVGSNLPFATADTCFYSDTIMEALLKLKLPIIEKEVGLELLPTYSYWRMYTYGASLPKHSDRPSCEISVTVNLSEYDGWPIFMDGNKIYLKQGDACIYKGCEVEHFRESLEENHQAQVFLHYVDKNGNNKDYKYDKRPYLGFAKT